jgi:hypothetical protein
MPAKQGGRQGDALGAGNPFDDDVTSDSKTRPPVSTATTFNPFDMWDRETKAGDVDFSSQPFDQFEQDKALTIKSQAATATATAEPDFFSLGYTSSSQQPQATTRAVEVNSDNDLLGLLTSQQPMLKQPRTGQQVDLGVAEVLLESARQKRIEEARARDQKEGNVNPFGYETKGWHERREERIAKSRIGQQRNPEQESLAPREEAPATHAESGKAEVTGNSVIKWLREAFSALHKTEQKSTTDTPESVQIQAAQNNADVGSSGVALQPKEAAVKGRIAQGVINFFKSFSLPSFSRKSSASAAPAPTAAEVDVNDFFKITPPGTSSAVVGAAEHDPFETELAATPPPSTQSFAGIEGVGEVGKILANAGVAQSGTSTAVVDGRVGAQPEGGRKDITR